MIKPLVIQKGDIYWINPNPIAGREMKDMHPFIVITPKEINALGIAMTVPVASGGNFAKTMGLTVALKQSHTKGIAVCNQVRSFDIETRIKKRTAKYIETLDDSVMDEIVDRVLSIIEPAN